jgi:hypothetical protein
LARQLDAQSLEALQHLIRQNLRRSQANPFSRQVGLQGRQTCGFQMGPYVAMVQVTSFDQQQLVGITSGCEQVVWQREGQVTPPLLLPSHQPKTQKILRPPPPGAGNSGGALKAWREKLDYLQQQEAITSDPGQKFTLNEENDEPQAEVRELAGLTMSEAGAQCQGRRKPELQTKTPRL